MEGNARPRFTPKQKAELWERWRNGQCIADIARALERRNKSGVYRVLALNGGISPAARRRAPVALRLEEREEISRGIAAGRSIRRIAARLGRAPSTVSREVRRHGGASAYRASQADADAWEMALRPKPCRLAAHPELRWCVAQKLALEWSPEQISGWLKREFPADEGMQVSHETIYRSLFVQTRGVLKKELMAHLRTARQMRQAKGGTTKSRPLGQLVDAVSIRERPAPGRGSRRARPLGRRPTLRGEQHAHGDAGRAAFSVCNAHQGPEQGHRDRGRRAEQTRAQITCGAAPIVDMGSGQGDGRAQDLHRRHKGAGLLLRSPQPMAARQQ